ncbi:MAG TPA: hypothetical protein VNP92_35335 [Actinophytocola sp.]|nr:hypothetical protein [Actinophytocola sp.]
MGNEQTYQSASEVLHAGQELQAALGDQAAVDAAVARLAAAAEQSIARLDQLDPSRGAVGVAGVESEPDLDELLTKALSQLHEANTLLAGSQAIGEVDTAEPAALEQPLTGFAGTLGRIQEPAPQVFAVAAAVSATRQDAIATCGKQVGATLDALTKRSTDAVISSITGMRDGGPDFLQKAWKQVNGAVPLDKIGGKLAKLGLQLLNGALGLLAKVMPTARLTEIRADLDTLIVKLDKGSPSRAIVGTVLGVDDARVEAERALAKPDLAIEQLDGGTAALAALAEKHDKQLELWDGISTAIGYARTAAAFVKLVVPQLGLIILGANLLVTGAVVVIGRDYVRGNGPSGTDGIRTIVATATA